MKIEIFIKQNIFEIFIDDEFQYNLPAYVDVTGSGIDPSNAYKLIELYPNRIFGLSELLISCSYDAVELLIELALKHILENKKPQNVLMYNIQPMIKKAVIKVNKKMKYPIEMITSCKGYYTPLIDDYKIDGYHYSIMRRIVAKDLAEKYVVSCRKKLYSGEKKRIRLLLERTFETYLEDILDGRVDISSRIFLKKKLLFNAALRLIIDAEIQAILDDIKSHKKTLDEIKSNIRAMEKLYQVAVISPFSYGKSTLLNAICGYNVLKTDVRAETSVVTKIKSMSHREIAHIKINGDSVVNKYSDIQASKCLLTTKDKSISEIHVALEMDHLEDVTLVDVPGLFSRHQTHNELSNQIVAQSNMVLFIIDPIQIGETNFNIKMKEYIKVLRTNRQEFCVVLSKKDLYDEDLLVIQKELNVVLKQLGIKDVKQFFVSGYFSMIGQGLKNGSVDLKDIQKNSSVYVMEDEFPVQGRQLNQGHADQLIEFGQVHHLINHINETKAKSKWGQ